MSGKGVLLHPRPVFSETTVSKSPHFIRIYNIVVDMPETPLALHIDDRGKPMVFKMTKMAETQWMTLEASFYGEDAYACVRVIDKKHGWRFLDASDIGRKFSEAVAFLCPRHGRGYLPEVCEKEYYSEQRSRWCAVDYETYHNVNIGDRMRFSINPNFPPERRIFMLDNVDVDTHDSFKIWIVHKDKNVSIDDNIMFKYAVRGHRLLPMIKLTPLQWGAGNSICPDAINNKQIKRPGLGRTKLNVKTNKHIIMGADYMISGIVYRALSKKSSNIYRFRNVVI